MLALSPTTALYDSGQFVETGRRPIVGALALFVVLSERTTQTSSQRTRAPVNCKDLLHARGHHQAPPTN
jgi:hypothetical protein